MKCYTCDHDLLVSEFVAVQATKLMNDHYKKAKFAVMGQDAYEQLCLEFKGKAVTDLATPVGTVSIVVMPSPYDRKMVRVVPSAEHARFMRGPI